MNNKKDNPENHMKITLQKKNVSTHFALVNISLDPALSVKRDGKRPRKAHFH